LEDGSTYSLSINDFRQHAFVTGATQYGKSTTVQKLLVEAFKKNIPFVVLEAAKKDYWRLTNKRGMNRIPVYSAGMDARKLLINPFQPEDNTRLEFHIQSLINALLAMFVQDDPLPQILTNLVYMCYEKRGWMTSQRVSAKENREYPILSDMLENLDECISSIGYSDDVKKDMKGVVTVRISSLIRQVGEFLNTRQNISIKDMYATSAIIELDDFDDVTKPFIASILAIKANEFSRQCSMVNKLHRLLVVEEAHHILPNAELRSSSPNSLRCSNYFSNMLAEVSAYGTGIIVVDQRASAISSSAIANTGVKIIHNIRQGDDIEAISRSMSLKEHEQSLLNKLNIGQVIISLPQTVEVCRVNVICDKESLSSMNIGCLLCNRDECITVNGIITPREEDIIENEDISMSALEKCIKSIECRHSIKLSHDEKICHVGRLVSKSADNNQIARQKLYDFNETQSRKVDHNENET
jgi:hypothetical protein